MRCLEFQEKIRDFLNNQLDIRETSAFMEHADICPECMEELEIRYMVTVGILEENRDERGEGYDYNLRLRRRLTRVRKELRRRYRMQILKYALSTLVFWSSIAMAVLLVRALFP